MTLIRSFKDVREATRSEAILRALYVVHVKRKRKQLVFEGQLQLYVSQIAHFLASAEIGL